MEIKFTKEQYENLIKLVYLGYWMIKSTHGDEEAEKFEEIEQYIYSLAKDFKLENYIRHNKEFDKYFPTIEFEEESKVEKYISEYNDGILWDELINRLAMRDLIKKYGEDAVEEMEFEERVEKQQPFIEKYENEFSKNGIENLVLKSNW